MKISRKIKNNLWEIFLVIAVLISIWVRIPALNPESLWFDDVWTALITKVENIKDFWLVNSSTPPLFGLGLFLSSKLIPDREISMQILSFFFSIVQIFLFYRLILFVEKNKFLAFLGGMILAFNEFVLVYSTRVKQYTIESFLTIWLLFEFEKQYMKLSKDFNLLKYIGISIFSLFLGFNAVLVSGFLVNIFGLEIFISKLKEKKIKKNLFLFSQIFIFDLIIVIYYLLIMKPKANQELNNFWDTFFINTNQSFFEIVKDIVAKFNVVIGGSFPVKWLNFIQNIFSFSSYTFLLILLIFMFLGIWSFWKKKNYILSFLGIYFYLTLLILGMLRIYPLGGQRLDIFSYPISIFYFIAGLEFLFDKVKIRLNLGVQIIAGIVVIFVSLPTIIKYCIDDWETKSSSYIIYIEENLKQNEGVLVFPHGAFSLGYYSHYPIEFYKANTLATGFSLRVKKENVIVMPPVTNDYLDRGWQLNNEMDKFLERNYEGFYFYAPYDQYLSIDYIQNYIKSFEYREVFRKQEKYSVLVYYKKYE